MKSLYRFIGFYWPQYDFIDDSGESVPISPQELADQTEKYLNEHIKADIFL